MGGVKGTAVPAARRYVNLAQGLSLMLPTFAESKSHQPCPVLIFVLSCDRDFTPDRNWCYVILEYFNYVMVHYQNTCYHVVLIPYYLIICCFYTIWYYVMLCHVRTHGIVLQYVI